MSWLQWQLAKESARSYEQIMVMAVLLPAAQTLVARVPPGPGDEVLDVGCGTGTVGRLVVPSVGPTGRVVGVDVNENMLAVARQACPEGRFELGDVRELRAADGSVDVVYAAHVVQFVAERARAARELARVVRPGGRVAVSTWSSLPANPYFSAVHDALAVTLGAEVAAPLAVACSLGDPVAVRGLLAGAGLTAVTLEETTAQADLGPLETFLPHHLASTPMSGVVRGAGDEAMAELVNRVQHALGAHRGEDVVVPFRQVVATGVRPA